MTSVATGLVSQSNHNLFLQLLKQYQKEHSRKTKNKTLQFYSLWEYDHSSNSARVFLESKTGFGYIEAEYDQNGMITIFRSPIELNTPNVFRQIIESLKAALERLIKKFRGIKQGGGGKKKGYYLKHGLGPTSAVRLSQALNVREISADFEREARRLAIGMSYYK